MLAEPVCDDRGWTFAVVQPDNLAQSRGGAKSSRFLGDFARSFRKARCAGSDPFYVVWLPVKFNSSFR